MPALGPVCSVCTLRQLSWPGSCMQTPHSHDLHQLPAIRGTLSVKLIAVNQTTCLQQG